MSESSAREALTDAIRYWEPRRIAYNAALTVIALIYFYLGLPDSWTFLSMAPSNIAFGLFVLAVLANVCYCAAYIVDIPAQMSGYRDVWLKYRWYLLAIGFAFAGVITRFFSIVLFSSPK
jgi:hypothetical protein